MISPENLPFCSTSFCKISPDKLCDLATPSKACFFFSFNNTHHYYRTLCLTMSVGVWCLGSLEHLHSKTSFTLFQVLLNFGRWHTVGSWTMTFFFCFCFFGKYNIIAHSIILQCNMVLTLLINFKTCKSW